MLNPEYDNIAVHLDVGETSATEDVLNVTYDQFITTTLANHDTNLPLPIKKRPHMHEMPYPTSVAINRKHVPVMCLTLEEEFNIQEYLVKKIYIYGEFWKAYQPICADNILHIENFLTK